VPSPLAGFSTIAGRSRMRDSCVVEKCRLIHLFLRAAALLGLKFLVFRCDAMWMWWSPSQVATQQSVR
jgi:hypothetical protein